MSYRQIIFEYPEGGGAYIVGKSNLGEWSGLPPRRLMIDYVLTALSASRPVLPRSPPPSRTCLRTVRFAWPPSCW